MEVPNGVVTWTSTVPALPGGATTVRALAVLTEIDVPGVPPKATVAAPVRYVPRTVTVFPPAKGPELGRTAETVVWGAETVVEAIWTAGLVQVRWTVSGVGLPSVTVRTRWLVVPADTEAGPAALPAVKLTDELLVARWTGNVFLGGRWMTGTVRVVVWGEGVAPLAVTLVV